MARPNISGANRAITLVGGLDALIRGSGSPSTWMTPERIGGRLCFRTFHLSVDLILFSRRFGSGECGFTFADLYIASEYFFGCLDGLNRHNFMS